MLNKVSLENEEQSFISYTDYFKGGEAKRQEVNRKKAEFLAQPEAGCQCNCPSCDCDCNTGCGCAAACSTLCLVTCVITCSNGDIFGRASTSSALDGSDANVYGATDAASTTSVQAALYAGSTATSTAAAASANAGDTSYIYVFS